MLNLILKLFYFIRGENVEKKINELSRLEVLSSNELATYKDRKLQDLLTHILKFNRFYQLNLNDKQLTEKDILDFYENTPLIDKKTITNYLNEFICEGVKMSWRSTSGSTGAPFIFPKDRLATAYMDAMMYCAYGWHGIRPGDREARLWGREVDFKRQAAQAVKDFLLGRKRLSAFTINDKRCAEFYRVLIKFEPKYFYAYPNVLYQFALSLERQGICGKNLEVPIAICTGEILFDYQKRKIEEFFGCKVVNEYGSSENGIIALECKNSNMHVLPTIFLEIHNSDKHGFGDIVVTELNSRSIPFVKYKNGDIGRIIPNKCSCRLPYPVLELKNGRTDSFIVLPNGDKVYDAILAYTLKNYAFQFRAIQESVSSITIHLVPKQNIKSTYADEIRSKLNKYFGQDFIINILVVDSISTEKSGKMRYFVSRL
ncbi:MAG: phenylacetate--CoA ligase family protein [Trichloromonadaceae bacterium]